MISRWVKLSVNNTEDGRVQEKSVPVHWYFVFIFSELTIKTACIRYILQSYFEGMMPDTHHVVTNLFAIRSEKFLFQDHSREHILTQR